MNKPEQKFCTDLKLWLRYNMPCTCFIEAKISQENRPFNYGSGFKPHQLKLLSQIKHDSFGYKISDEDMRIKPFDLFFAKKDIALVAIKWIRHGNKKFYLIDPDTIQGEIDDGKKSLTEERAEQIALFVGELGKIEKVKL